MTISVFLDPTKLPNQAQSQATFDTNMAAFFANLPTFVAQFNASTTNLNSSLNGAGISIPYTIDLSSTADADPGNGNLRFNSTTQNAATVLRLDLLGAGSNNPYTNVLDTFDSSTNPVKGRIAIVRQGDASTFLMFDVTARAAPSGYRNITVTPIASSSANPFIQGDAVLLFFQRAGDAGISGFSNMIVIRSTQTWTAPAGIFKAKITVVDGGQGGGTSTTANYANAGIGGNTSISARALVPGTVYTATVGAGGAGASSGNGNGGPGGASSFSGSGFTTLTSANGDLQIAGDIPTLNANGYQCAGGSFLSSTLVYNGSATGIGQGGPAAPQGIGGNPGAPGAVIIEY
jgi:hypothetical protein